MKRRLREVIRGVLALATVAILIIGVPIALLRFGGTPGGGIARALTDELSSDNTKAELLLGGTLMLIAWLCWAQLTFALVTEMIAVARGTVTRRATVLPGIQAVARRLVATSTLLIATVAPSASAVAAPLLPISTSSEPTEMLFPAPTSGTPTQHASLQPSGSATTVLDAVYVVQDRDTFWDLSDRFLGDGLRWQELRAASVGCQMPDGSVITGATEALQPGWILRLPPGAAQPTGDTGAAGTASPSSQQVEISRGEHFWQLATDALAASWGRTPTDPEIAPFWADMVAANDANLAVPGNPDLIYAGQQVLLPSAPADPAVGQPPPPPPPPSVEPEERSQPSSPPPAPPPAPTSTAPTVTPTTTAATAAPSLASPAADTVAPPAEETTDDATSARDLILGLGALATGAGALAITLRRLRHQQGVRRQPGVSPRALPAASAEYERRTRSIADVDSSRWIDAVNRYLTRQLANHATGTLPAVIAARAGALGVELLLDEPTPPIEGFVQDPTSDSAWRLDPSIELAALEAQATGHQHYCPALLPVGRTAAGDLHLDLEQIGILAVDGPADATAGWFRTIATAAATVEAAEHCTVVALDAGPGLAGLDRVVVPADPGAWVSQIADEMRRLNDRLDQTPYQLRASEGEIFHPTIVLVGPGQTALARTLVDAAALINTPLAVVAAAPLGLGSRLALTATSAMLEPHGLDFVPALTSASEVSLVGSLIASTADDPVSALPATPPQPVATMSPAGGEPGRAAAAEVIDRVTRKRPIEVAILTPTPRVRGLRKEPTSKIGAVISYLAYHRTVSSQAVRDQFWPASTNRSTADNALSQVRQLLGTTAAGSHRLGIASNTGRYELSDEVGCDWTKVKTLVDEAGGRSGQDAIDLLRAALEQVGGKLGVDAARNYDWLRDDYEVYGTIERVVVDAAHRLGELALGAGDHALARRAASMGLSAVPGQEALHRLEMRAAAAAGDLDGVRTAYRAAVHAAEALGPWSEVQPETVELLKSLTAAAYD